jgi:PTH1 family peptidyl-tRNA hydrolase
VILNKNFMKLIIGLGNPGEQYKNTRHNTGFEFADKLQKIWNFPAFELNNNFDAVITISNIIIPRPLAGEGAPVETGAGEGENNRIVLAKPQTFMNLSGEAVQKMLAFYKLTPDDIIVIHDDLDIDLGSFKIATDSSSAGHNGVQDIIDKLGTQKFKRIRIGIKNPESEKIPAESYVLQKFTEEEKEKIEGLFEDIKNEIEKNC